MRAPPTVFLDASVLYPSLLRNFVMHLAMADLFKPRWSDAVHEEWIRALLRDRPDLSRKRLDRTRMLMEENVDEANVVGFEHRIEHLILPDADDRHVLAAAIHCGAEIIVTSNTRHFPKPALAPHGIVARRPDRFMLDIIQENVDDAVNALREMRSDLKKPRYSAGELLAGLERQGLARTIALLQVFHDRI